MTEGDLDQVSAIEAEAFPTAWPATAYRRELSNKLARYLVLVDNAGNPQPAPPVRRSLFQILKRQEPAPATNDFIVGYVGVWFLLDEAHVVAIAVREGHRGKGLGELLLANAIDLAVENNQASVTLEVRRSNLVAQALYEKYKFLKVGVRQRYYSDNGEDAIIMSTPPIQHENYLANLRFLQEALARRWPPEEQEA